MKLMIIFRTMPSFKHSVLWLPVVIKPIPILDMLVYIMVLQLEIGMDWMIIGWRKVIDRRNILIYELEGVSGKCICHIEV
jgi:hypothetical protein